MIKELEQLLQAEGDAAEAAERSEALRSPEQVKVTRGHERSKVLQVRLNENEYERLSAYADSLGLPISTAARSLILGSLTDESAAEADLRSILERLEHDVLTVKRLTQTA